MRTRASISRTRLLRVALVPAVIVLLGACGGSSKPATHGATTTTARRAHAPSGPIAPLTGLADPTGASTKRCAITVKIDNTPQARPQYGIDQADVVYEEVVEGGITRLAAVFNAHAPDRVGPVRSVRKTDQSIVWPLRGVFAYSGGAAYAIESINTAPVVQLDETRAGALMFRDTSRSAPHNLYAHVDQMYARCKDGAPQPLFQYRSPTTPTQGTPATAATVGFQNGYAVTWRWDTNAAGWQRNIFGAPDVVASGATLTPKNVVVMFVPYVGGNQENLGAEAQLVGRGTAWVLSRSRVIKGTWVRTDKASPARLLDASGNDILLTPGQTWVELVEPSYSVTLTP